ncbi:Oxidoreductase, short chain dehydrogenase/reductase family protein [Aphelenchoides besseyi]|nr:Oxidoreductase, short chain dehydrogenase/reductase family protein [Aphelenchoides besseyi]
MSEQAEELEEKLQFKLPKKVAEDSKLILVARSSDRLEETRNLILKESKVTIELVIADLSQLDSSYLDKIKEHLVNQTDSMSNFLVVHNAGTLGAIHKRANELNSSDDWHSFLHLNLISTILLNNLVFNTIKDRLSNKSTNLLVVDITSLAATTAFPSFTQYSVGKASRESYFRSFSVENPSVRVLSYSPGPVETDMRQDVIDRTFSDDLRNAIRGDGGTEVNRKTLTTTETVNRLMKILEANDFKSGSRIDYFDQ